MPFIPLTHMISFGIINSATLQSIEHQQITPDKGYYDDKKILIEEGCSQCSINSMTTSRGRGCNSPF